MMYSTIGEIIRHYRTSAHLSQNELASGICDRKYISKIELNKCIPTLDIINQLSDRLEINLYDSYALMLRHCNIETHKKITKLNEYFSSNQIKLKPLIQEYSKLEEFKSGEPYQYLKYAEALYAAYVLHDFSTAIEKASEGLHVADFHNPSQKQVRLSNIESNLLLSYGVNNCRINNLEIGKSAFDYLLHYLHDLLSQYHYIVNRNYHYEQNLLGLVTYNYFVFLRDFSSYEELLDQIDKALNILDSLKNAANLPDLLFCKTYLLYKLGNKDLALETYYTAHSFSMYYYKDNYAEIETDILDDIYEQIKADASICSY
ncbi:MAG: multiprotein-bridging factor 1 family protein [Lachnospiraceae bacterium]